MNPENKVSAQPPSADSGETAADILAKVVDDAMRTGTGMYRIDPSEFMKAPSDTAPIGDWTQKEADEFKIASRLAASKAMAADTAPVLEVLEFASGFFPSVKDSPRTQQLIDTLRDKARAALGVAQQNPKEIVHVAGGAESADTRLKGGVDLFADGAQIRWVTPDGHVHGIPTPTDMLEIVEKQLGSYEQSFVSVIARDMRLGRMPNLSSLLPAQSVSPLPIAEEKP
jgi:hypothetical protein